MYKIILTVVYGNPIAENHQYFSGTAITFNKSIDKGLKMAWRLADGKSGGSQYCLVLRTLQIVNAYTGKVIHQELY